MSKLFKGHMSGVLWEENTAYADVNVCTTSHQHNQKKEFNFYIIYSEIMVK